MRMQNSQQQHRITYVVCVENPPPSTNSPPTLPSFPPPNPYIVLRDTLCSCEAYGMRPMHKKKSIAPRQHIPTDSMAAQAVFQHSRSLPLARVHPRWSPPTCHPGHIPAPGPRWLSHVPPPGTWRRLQQRWGCQSQPGPPTSIGTIHHHGEITNHNDWIMAKQAGKKVGRRGTVEAGFDSSVKD